MSGLFPDSPGRVVHCRLEACDIYVGRPTIYGNPYSHLPGKGDYQVATRTEAISKFADYARGRMGYDLVFRAAVLRCYGKTLGCWCAPEACHAWVLLRLADEWINASKNQ